ncbi:Vanillate o-demethylase [Lasiodiplodia theobromae]|uniref:Vanillate o-demethylase n=1 Tax=Lasiodiplodia theobromae TaxID=45133 RepID=UPI0015C3801D|nr:Vanillate o-demethylase [Lasiodiplodia theobromae]KAF4535479.1 Vanillate o-demethylase [Lasiodiplodia theobromae]
MGSIDTTFSRFTPPPPPQPSSSSSSSSSSTTTTNPSATATTTATAAPASIDFTAPWTTDTLLQVRTGKTRTVPGTSIPSAIAKRPRLDPDGVRLTALGLAGDQQTFFKHGGPDKAVLQYCAAHYAAWQAELPPHAAAALRPGGFGENFVTAGRMSEWNVCIGDVVEVGGDGGARLQVSLPRAPCYKLNHRFQVDGMARLSQETGRTGWYYRVLREGTVKVGDEIRLVERKNPKWTVRRVQEILHKDKKNEEAVRELANLPELGEDFRLLFQNRLKRKFGNMGAENEEGRLWGSEQERMEVWRKFKVAAKRRETAKIASFVFEALEPVPNPQMVKPGAHIRIKLQKLIRSYSVVGGDSNILEIGVALNDNSRGGSKYLHDCISAGDTLEISAVNESFPLQPQAQKHVLIAGGIGITAFIPAARTLASQCIPWELHLCVNSENDIPFRRYLEILGHRLIIYSKADGNRLDIRKLVASQTVATHIYCCGPERMMESMAMAADSLNFPKQNVHFEAFTANLTGDPFSVELVDRGKCLEVPSNDTLLDVLRESGFDVPSSCEVGNCATCKVRLVSGRVDHRGTALEENEKRDNMLSCVSRGVGRIAIKLLVD